MSYDPYADARPRSERMVVERVQRASTAPVMTREDTVVREGFDGARGIDIARRLAVLVFGVLQVFIVLRIVLLLLGANEGNALVGFITGVTDPLVATFRGMFGLDEVTGASGSVLDVAAIVALVAWTLVEAVVLGILGLADRRPVVA